MEMRCTGLLPFILFPIPLLVFSGTTSQILKGLLLREHTKTAPKGPSPVCTRLCSSRIHSSLAPSFCLTLFKFRRERSVLFLVRDKLIFLSQAAFRSGQYAHGWPPPGSYPPSRIIFSQEDRVIRLAARSTGLYARRRHLSSSGAICLSGNCHPGGCMGKSTGKAVYWTSNNYFKQCFDRFSTNELETYGLNFH